MSTPIRCSPTRIWIARGIAVAADLVQVAFLPASVEGVFSPIADGIDLAMAVIMTVLVGWHIVFIPSFFVKFLPVGDLAPTWTMAVLIATRGRTAKQTAASPLPELEAAGWRPWYDSLRKPGWTPSPSTIGLIWTLLYPLIVISFGFVFIQCFRGKIPWIVALPFAVNLAANLIFTPILFGLKRLWWATTDILIVLGTILWAIVVVWPNSQLVALAQLPYLIWVSIATVLQISIAVANNHQGIKGSHSAAA